MKFLISSDCFLKSGDLAEAGQVIEVAQDEATALKLAGRGYPAPDEPEPTPAPEPEPVSDPALEPAPTPAAEKPSKAKK